MNAVTPDSAADAANLQGAGSAGERNGTGPASDPAKQAEGPMAGTAAEQTPRSTSERAEEIADTIAVKIGTFTSLLGRKLIQIAAHVREATSDFWAEVQDLRHRRDKE
jgi:hypothetical protein